MWIPFRLQQPLPGSLGAFLPRCYPGTSERHLELLSIDQPNANGFTPAVNCTQPLQPHPMTTDVIPDLAPFFRSLTTFVSGKVHSLGSNIPQKCPCRTNKLVHSHTQEMSIESLKLCTTQGILEEADRRWHASICQTLLPQVLVKFTVLL